MRIGLCSSGGHLTPPLAYGSEVTTWYLAEEYAKAGHEVLLIAAAGSKTPPGGQLIEIPLDLLACTSTEKDTLPETLQPLMGCDIVHDCSSSHCWADAIHLYGNDRHVATLNGISFYTPRHKHNVCVLSEAARQAGKFSRSAWGDDYPQFRYNPGWMPNSRVVPYGTDTEFYTPTPDFVEDYVVFVGRPDPAKGCHIILQIAQEMPQQDFVLAWRAEYPDHKKNDADYRRMASELKNVHFVELPEENHHEAKRKLYQQAVAFLQPTCYIEAMGLTACEAMSCGTPVILANKGSAPEIVRPGVTGFLCNAFSDYLDAISTAKSLSRTEARRDAVERFDKSIMAGRYLKIFEEVLQGVQW